MEPLIEPEINESMFQSGMSDDSSGSETFLPISHSQKAGSSIRGSVRLNVARSQDIARSQELARSQESRRVPTLPLQSGKSGVDRPKSETAEFSKSAMDSAMKDAPSKTLSPEDLTGYTDVFMSWRPSPEGLADHTSLSFALQTATAMAASSEEEAFFEELSNMADDIAQQPGFA